MIRFYVQSLVSAAVSWGGYCLCAFRELLSDIPAVPARIAVVQLGHLGDLVLTVPLVRAIRARYPDANLELIVLEYGKPIAESLFHDADSIAVYNSAKYARGGESTSDIPDLSRYDLVVYVRGDLSLLLRSFMNLKTAFISCLARHNKLRWSFLYHLGLPLKYSSRHQYEMLARAASKIGAQISPYPEVVVNSELDSDVCAKIAAGEQGYLVVHPGAPWASRRWPSENFAYVCKALYREQSLDIVVIGGAESSVLAKSLREDSVKCVHLGESLGFVQLAALLRNCKLYIGNDSGPAHLAAACGAPVVAIYGPETPSVFGVLGKRVVNIYSEVQCSPCWQKSCIYQQKCLRSVVPQMVLSRIREVFA